MQNDNRLALSRWFAYSQSCTTDWRIFPSAKSKSNMIIMARKGLHDENRWVTYMFEYWTRFLQCIEAASKPVAPLVTFWRKQKRNWDEEAKWLRRSCVGLDSIKLMQNQHNFSWESCVEKHIAGRHGELECASRQVKPRRWISLALACFTSLFRAYLNERHDLLHIPAVYSSKTSPSALLRRLFRRHPPLWLYRLDKASRFGRYFGRNAKKKRVVVQHHNFFFATGVRYL